MVYKRMVSKNNKRYRTCLRCDDRIKDVLKDDTVYTCPQCRQQHFVDLYPERLSLTVIEKPDIRHRHLYQRTIEIITPGQKAARQALLKRVEESRSSRMAKGL